MVNVCMELTNKPPISKEAIITWWSILNKFDYFEVEKSFDTWINENSKAPTPNDIKNLCQIKINKVYAKLPNSNLDVKANKQHMADLNNVVDAMTSNKKDYRAWARKIVLAPHNYPALSLKLAKEALNMENI